MLLPPSSYLFVAGIKGSELNQVLRPDQIAGLRGRLLRFARFHRRFACHVLPSPTSANRKTQPGPVGQVHGACLAQTRMSPSAGHVFQPVDIGHEDFAVADQFDDAVGFQPRDLTANRLDRQAETIGNVGPCKR